MGHIGAGHVIGDHLHACSAAGAGGLVDLLAGDEGGGSDGVRGRDGGGGGIDDHGLGGLCEREWDVEDGIGAGGEGDLLRAGGKAGSGDLKVVDTDGHLGKREGAAGVGGGPQDKG